MKILINILSSLRLTVILLGFCVALVFFGTLDQVQLGIHEAQERYFESYIALYPYKGDIQIPLPGGFLLGGLLIINLVVAHWRYFKPGWKKAGISMIHAGIVLLLISGFVTAIVQEESHLAAEEGQTVHYSFTQRESELVITDTSAEETNTEYAIPAEIIEKKLEKGESTIQDPKLPFTVEIHRYHRNSLLSENVPDGFFERFPTAYPVTATQGLAIERTLAILPQPMKYAQDDVNTPTAIVELFDGSTSIGTWMVSGFLDSDHTPSQDFEYEGKSYQIALRFMRFYTPYSMTPIEVKHDRYPGTNIPKNFSSLVDIHNPETGEHRQQLIYMNHPLRYEGLTYYQSGMDEAGSSTVLQVVRNPGWTLPYIAVTLVGIGMAWQFGFSLMRYLDRNAKKGAKA